jgi:hypothetical protein
MGVSAKERLKARHTPIGRGIINKDKLNPLLQRLLKERTGAPFDISLHLIDRNTNRELHPFILSA